MSVKTAYLSREGGDFAISEHFKLREFASKDGADKVLYSTALLAKLEELRAYGGFTVEVNSGYRTASYNRKIGGASLSQHVAGTAADITVKKNGIAVDAKVICCLCQSLGFKGVAYISPTALHVDMRLYGTYRGDERKGYRGNVGNDFYTYFGVSRADVEKLKIEEEEIMTQEQFNEMMDTWLAQKKTEAPADWSQKERAWAEWENLILGDSLGNMSYKSFCTREEMVVFLYRLAQLLGKEGL